MSASQQNADRSYGVARLERLALDRARLIAALDATFPAEDVPIKNLGAADPTQSCQPAPGGDGSLHTELANLLGRLTALYDDGTLPASTESLGSVVQSFNQSGSAQEAWAHFNSRAGYRPVSNAIGAVRPVLAYKDLRAFANATLKLLSPDSDPYSPSPMKDAHGNRIGVPGAAYPQLSAIVAAAKAELKNATPDPAPAPLVLAQGADPTLGAVLNRPMTDLEAIQSVLFHQDPAFAKAPFAIGGGASSPHAYIVQRDPRGYAAVPLVKGSLPAPFLSGSDGLPEVNALGAFMTTGGKPAPTPFPTSVADSQARDSFGRALGAGGQPIYGYLDTNQTFLSVVMANMRGAVSGKSLVDSNQTDNHETLMNAFAGVEVIAGPRSPTATPASRTYADGTQLAYTGFQPVGAPLGDLVYALGQILADPTADATLSFLSALTTQNPNDVARLIGDTLYDKAQADKHPEATIPAASTFWDDMIDLVTQIATDTSAGKNPGQTRLLEDILTAFADPASLGLSKGLASQSGNLDVISYDRSNLNGPAVNLTTKDASPPKTPPDHTKPDANANRSELQRFAQLVHDTSGVTLCNKEGAVLHAVGTPLGAAAACASTAGNPGELCLHDTDCTYGADSARPFHECEMLMVDNLAGFYLDSIVGQAEPLLSEQARA